VTKAARRVFAGFPGTWLGPELKEILAWGVGGVVIFSRNVQSPEQVAALVQEIHAAAAHPTVIAIDQEGGRVARLREPLTLWPPALSFVQAGPELAQAAGKALASELYALGVTLDFAPDLDILTHSENPVVGDRAFGTTADQVTRLARAWNAGAHQAGIATCGKHAPGHGPTTSDSHDSLPEVTVDAQTLRSQHLAPFRALASELDSIMMAHLLCPEIDPAMPASLSPAILAELRAFYSGLLLCDALEMGALNSYGDMRDRAHLALQAGNDVLLACSEPADVEDCVAACRDHAGDHDFESRHQAALNRLDDFVQRYPPVAPAPASKRDALLGCPEHQEIARRIASFGPPAPQSGSSLVEQG